MDVCRNFPAGTKFVWVVRGRKGESKSPQKCLTYNKEKGPQNKLFPDGVRGDKFILDEKYIWGGHSGKSIAQRAGMWY